MPLTKAPESSVLNFLAISMYSLIETFGGMSSRWSSSKIARRRMVRSMAAIRAGSQCSEAARMRSSIDSRCRSAPRTSSSAKERMSGCATPWLSQNEAMTASIGSPPASRW